MPPPGWLPPPCIVFEAWSPMIGWYYYLNHWIGDAQQACRMLALQNEILMRVVQYRYDDNGELNEEVIYGYDPFWGEWKTTKATSEPRVDWSKEGF